MANSLTHKGEEYALFGDGAGDGSLARLATEVRLYKDTSVPDKDGTGFTEVDNGNGYTTGGIAITVADWTFSVVSDYGRIQLDDQIWTASGGQIPDIAGAYLTDAGGNVLAWWERSSVVTLDDGDTLTLDDLIVRMLACP